MSIRTGAILIGLFIALTAGSGGASPAAKAVNAMSKPGLVRVVLDGGWLFRQAGREEWHGAMVPGCVHTDLMENGMIPDPFYRDNELGVQWVENEKWEYAREIQVDDNLLKKSHIELVCKGLDTFAAVLVNGEKAGETENMFRGYRFEIKPFLRAGKNEIKILFDSPVVREKALEAKVPYKLPGGAPHLRKAPYHFGWDWGPRLVTSGIWRSIFLEAWDKSRIEELEISQDFVSRDEVELRLKLNILSEVPLQAVLKACVSGKKPVETDQTITLMKGANTREIVLKIR